MNFSWLVTVGTILSAISTRSAVPIKTQSQQTNQLKLKKQQFWYRECGRKHKNKAIQVDGLDISPSPIAIPGPVNLGLRLNVTRTIPNNVDIKLTLKKRYFGIWWKLPCVNGFGSCNYTDQSLCDVAGSLLGCPVKQKYYDIATVMAIHDPWETFNTPVSVLTGDYKAMVKIKHPVTKELLGCVRGQFEISRQKNPRLLYEYLNKSFLPKQRRRKYGNNKQKLARISS